jgi:D-alanyl-lipoteichoic acid acyltransferase DltB (MBOAT superfamily)
LFLVGASWFFYGYWDSRFVLLLAASTAGNFLAGELISRALGPGDTKTAASKLLVGAAVAFNLAGLAWFKYYGFFVSSLHNALSDFGMDLPLPLLHVTLPIGISFFTFQAISYVVDIGRADAKPMRPLDFAVYLSFFPHLVAGPIVRATEFAPQLERPMRASAIPAGAAFMLILGGLFKKVVISSYLASHIVDPVFSVPAAHSSPEILLAIYAYAIQIYADFSGYTDIAIGCALLLGIRFPLNFDAPYTARSLQDFWRRWHMSLSRWLRDYLYIPLGGSRGSRLFTARNLMLTFVLGGLWHGAAWTFVIWGTIHGTGLVVERWAREAAGRRAQSVATLALQWFVTFHVVCLAWVFFRAETFADARELLTRLVTARGPAPLVTPMLVTVVVGAVALQFVPKGSLERLQVAYMRLGPVLQGATLAVALVMIDVLGPQGVSPFIYFQF